MEHIYCMNCMRQTPAYPCPLCGYDPKEAPVVSQALEQSILHGRYLTGRAMEKNNIEIIYKGLDLYENKPVTIWEFFPMGQADRLEDGTLRWKAPPSQSQEAMRSQIRQRISQTEICDSFPENDTVYVVCKPRPPCPPAPLPQRKENGWLPFLLALLVLSLSAIALAPFLMTFL